MRRMIMDLERFPDALKPEIYKEFEKIDVEVLGGKTTNGLAVEAVPTLRQRLNEILAEFEASNDYFEAVRQLEYIYEHPKSIRLRDSKGRFIIPQK